MTEFFTAVTAPGWYLLGLLAVGVGLGAGPRLFVQLGVLLYPPGHSRRAELLAEFAIVPYRKRPYVALDFFVHCLFTGPVERWRMRETDDFSRRLRLVVSCALLLAVITGFGGEVAPYSWRPSSADLISATRISDPTSIVQRLSPEARISLISEATERQSTFQAERFNPNPATVESYHFALQIPSYSTLTLTLWGIGAGLLAVGMTSFGVGIRRKRGVAVTEGRIGRQGAGI